MHKICKTFYFTRENDSDFTDFCHCLEHELLSVSSRRPVVFLCIGTDRATGDSLGPLIGQSLSIHLEKSKARKRKAVVYGTLHQPVHATNLSQTLSSIYDRYKKPYIIAIDASLGSREHLGYVTLGQGSLRPGIGVARDLPAAGDMHITGIVNASSKNNQIVLQTTRLSTVVDLAGFISRGLLEVLHVCSAL